MLKQEGFEEPIEELLRNRDPVEEGSECEGCREQRVLADTLREYAREALQ